MMKLNIHYDEIPPLLSTTSLRYFVAHILSMPLSLGGLASRRHTSPPPAAFIASLAAIAALNPPPALAAYCDQSTTLSSDSLLYQWIEDTLAAMRAAVGGEQSSSEVPQPSHPPPPPPPPPPPSPSSVLPHADPPSLPEFSPADLPAPVKVCLPPTSSSLFLFYHVVPQRATDLQYNFICQASTLSCLAALKTAQESGDAVREPLLLSIAAMKANTWKRVFPSSPLLTLSDEQYRIAARLNLGLPPHRLALPSKCPSCDGTTALLGDGWHHLSCQSHKRREVTARHAPCSTCCTPTSGQREESQ